jgi:hypothetical protein
MRALVTILVLGLPGCCWTAKRTCFPPCKPPTKILVKAESPCELPPELVLADVARSSCPSTIRDWACLPPLEAGKLANNIFAMKTWIREVRARCEAKPTPQPTSQPTNP